MVLKSFRNASHSLVIKIIFTAIILSFCLWGVGDIIRNYTSSRAVITVNERKVTVERFFREYSQEKQRIQNIGKNPLSNEELSKLGLKDAVLDRLLNETVLECVYEQLGILVPKQTLVELIHSLPQFQNNGGFDSRIYAKTLRNSGVSEGMFINDIRNNIIRTQLFHSFMVGYKLPKIVKTMLIRDFTKNYTVMFKQIDLDKMTMDKKFTEDELKQYYEENKDKYSIPEKRDISVLVIDYSKLADSVEINEADVERVYQETKDLYIKEETRTFERFTFVNNAEAQKAWHELNKGTSINKIQKMLTPKINELCDARRKDFSSRIGNELFTLKKGAISGVYKIGDKFYIYRIKSIKTPKQMTKGEIKSEIRAEMKKERQESTEYYDKVKELRNKIDDGFGAGKTIKEVANDIGMNVIEIRGITTSDSNSKLNGIIPDEDTLKEVEEGIFETEEGQATQTIESHNDGKTAYVVYIQRITPKKIPEYKYVSEQVRKDYAINQAEKTIQNELGKMTTLGRDATAEMKKLYKPEIYSFSKRDAYSETPISAVQQVMKAIRKRDDLISMLSRLRSGEVTYEKVGDKRYVIIGIEKDKHVPTTKEKESDENIISQINQIVRNDMLSIITSAYRSKQKVKINRQLANEVAKGTSETE